MGALIDIYFLLCISLILSFFYFAPLCSAFSSFPSSCTLRRKFHLNEMHKPGDVVIGGLFEVHYSSVFPEQTFTKEPKQPSCRG